MPADTASRWADVMREALRLAQSPDAPFGENPRVGCVIVDADGRIAGRGYHHGAGSPHAEVEALVEAGDAARGGTAVVTLEPCRHVGRTGPCTQALIDAGVSSVVFGQSDPTEEAGGGAAVLRAAGVEVLSGLLIAECERVNEAWTFAVGARRPMVTWKVAVSLDGRVAGPDGGPTPITGVEARTAVHELRAQVGAIVVGTGTALVDDPALTVRLPGAASPPPLRVVVGSRAIPDAAAVLDDRAPTLLLDERDPAAVLEQLYHRGVRHVLLEGGPTLAAAFLRARLVDRVDWYVAPMLLGDGPVALAEWASIDDTPVGVDVESVTVVGQDVRVVGRVAYEQAGR
jgi:diaminohydroxyphosphoribosylaminopyrimidine deaminase / 5-amino-6-(5-phosphoribosylamino)uracil reductase